MVNKKYTGEALLAYNAEFDLDPYFPSEELIRAIEVARLLKRPLLLRGAPGSGKTRLAEALAFELYGEKYQEYYFRWNVKSTTKAVEGLYQYDHLLRLRDAQMQRDIEAIQYWELGPLGEAFLKSFDESAPAILLIDEIDKADIDFPNDLLDVLEDKNKSFPIKEEKGIVIEAKATPIIIITSNDERELPEAFLRRCVFHYLPFPDEDRLFDLAEAYIQKHNPDGELEAMLRPLIKYFKQKYETMEASKTTDKIVSTSELLDWLRVISFYKPYKSGEIKVTDEGLEFKDGKVPYPEVLFKSHDDWKSNKGK